jgi:hypothetical protein
MGWSKLLRIWSLPGVGRSAEQPTSTHMPAPRISYAEFELSFADTRDTEDDEPCPGKEEQLEAMEELVPSRARFLGNLTNEIAHSPGLTWVIDDHYYLLPCEKNGYTWALFRIAWDDNWGRYEFQAEARIRGVTDPMEARPPDVPRFDFKMGLRPRRSRVRPVQGVPRKPEWLKV